MGFNSGFKGLKTFGHTIQHPLISGESQRNTSVSRQLLKCNQQIYCHHFSNAADGWWQEHTWLFGHHWAHAEATVHKLFISPRRWWGYGKHLLERFWLLYQLPCMNYCTYIQGQISLVPRGIHLSPMLGLHCKRHHLSLPGHA